MNHCTNTPCNTIVMKFGGASLATPGHFDIVAKQIIEKGALFSRIVVVVSAMGQATDELISLAKSVHPTPPQREYDMLLSVGERISMALLAMAIAKEGKEAVSLTGSQSGIITSHQHTEAQIIEIRPGRILKNLEEGKIVIVAGFQGVSRFGEITTLGRGGSDTTAVALGAVLKAEIVEFYKDVPGIFSEDPKIAPQANLFSQMNYDEVLQLVQKGAKVLHYRSLLLAQANQIPLRILSFKEEYNHLEGTLINPSLARKERPIFEGDILYDTCNT